MYKRVSNIDEIIQDVKLAYDAWKTLFLLSEETSLEEIAATLQEEPEKIQTHLDRLQEAGLVETITSEELPAEADEEPVQTNEETVTEEPPIPVAEPEAAESTETPAEEEAILEETEPEDAAEVAKEPETAIEEEAIADLLEEVEEPLTEKIDEAPPVAEEDDMADENIIPEQADEAPESLDFDFEEAAGEKEEEPAAVEEIPELEELAPPSGSKNVILVIDDSIVIRKMVEIALENEDLIVETAVSGKDGMDKIDQINPSLIILDLMLPDINGIDILKTVKAARKIPVIMLSGKDSPQMVENAKNAGADAFLPKPFKDDELKDQIKTLLEA